LYASGINVEIQQISNFNRRFYVHPTHLTQRP